MLEISTELAQAIHDYLIRRPLLEVEELVNGIRQLKEKVVEDKKK